MLRSSPSPEPQESAHDGRVREALAERYRILHRLGQGATATVYLAEDLRHPREVAVKVFRPSVTSSLGSDRFLREVEIASRLAHPYILPVLDSGEADELLFYVMPRLGGETLRARLDREGALAVPEAVGLLRDVAEALAHAHDRGVIHRDIKPANILLTSGHALVMDFGIAKALRGEGDRDPLTAPGLAIGSPGYMAPEQAVGDPDVDRRVDIYALGVLGYEALAGVPPFSGRGPRAILAAQLARGPDPIDHRRERIPGPLAEVLTMCMAKDPDDRWQEAGEVVARLGEIESSVRALGPHRESGPTWWRRSARIRRPVSAAAVLIVAAVVAGVWYFWIPTPDVPGARFRQVTFDGDISGSAISADGRRVAYVRSTPDSGEELWVRDLDGDGAIRLAGGMSFVTSLEWVAEDSLIHFRTADSTGAVVNLLIPSHGGAATPFAQPPFARVSPAGREVALWGLPGPEITILDRSDGTVRSVRRPSSVTWLVDLVWSPDGSRLALHTETPDRGGSALWSIGTSGGGEERLVVDSVPLGSPRYDPRGGALYYLRYPGPRAELWKLVLDDRGRADGRPSPVLTGLDVVCCEPGWSQISLSADGRTLAYTRHLSRVNLVTYSLDEARGLYVGRRQITQGTSRKSDPALSPDGTWIAYSDGDGSASEIHRIRTSGGAPQRLTALTGVSGGPAWSPDGRSIAFLARVDSSIRVWRVPAEGGPAASYDGTHAGNLFGLLWAPGERILYQRPGNRNWHSLEPRTGEERPLVEDDSLGWIFSPAYAPEGDRVAFRWNRVEGGNGLWVLSSDGDQPRRLREGDLHVDHWVEGGRLLAVHDGETDERYLLNLSGERVADLPALPSPCSGGHVLTPDGALLVCAEDAVERDVWLVEDFDARE